MKNILDECCIRNFVFLNETNPNKNELSSTKLCQTVGYNDSNKFNDITATAPILSVTTKIGVDFGVQDHKFGVQK